MIPYSSAPLFRNQTTIHATPAVVRHMLHAADYLPRWNPALTTVSGQGNLLHVTRAGMALNAYEDLTIIDLPTGVRYTGHGHPFSYQLDFTLVAVPTGTTVQEAFRPVTMNAPHGLVHRLATVAQVAFARNLALLKRLIESSTLWEQHP